ncbi:hypothetical protein LBMAG42_38730 [Deltaproteobacteria bacterium]|nr:hypothetical protein LBMAG42_38730 [Deltaproteobacteria bacterium]
MLWFLAACCLPFSFPVDTGLDSAPICFDRDGDGVETCLGERGDCNDFSANTVATYEGEEECNGVDDDCDLQVDEEVGWHPDADGDGHGDESVVRCEKQAGDVHNGDDCNDASAAAYEGKTEVCDGLDNDCDGYADEYLIWYPDQDGDGFGADAAPSCDPSGTQTPGDCDDLDDGVYPDASERCNGADDDCNGEIDEETTLWTDADLDGWGVDPSGQVEACAAGYSPKEGDCDDTEPLAYPGALETCEDTADLNCDGSVGSDDLDRDGSPACEDCDDSVWFIYPGATETCDDGIDEDCDGEIDEGC